jgi:hypothetical protein
LSDIPGDITIPNHVGKPEPLQRLEPHKSVLALGIMFNPMGSMTEEVQYLRSKAEKWAEQVRSGFLKKHEAWYSINLCIMKSIEYPLLATTMSKSQIDYVLAPILRVGLPKMGVCRNISRKLVFSNFKFQGLGMVHPFVLQGLRKLMLMVEQTSSLPLLQHVKQTSWAMTRIESGAGPQFLQQPYSKYNSFITLGWITTIWEFVSRYQIKLQNNTRPLKRRSKDEYIMHLIVQGNYKPYELRWFNACRLYLQVELLSDLFNAQGTRVKDHIWQGRKVQHSRYTIQWPNQPRPTNAVWSVWRIMLQKCLLLDDAGIIKPIGGVVHHSIIYFKIRIIGAGSLMPHRIGYLNLTLTIFSSGLFSYRVEPQEGILRDLAIGFHTMKLHLL